MNVRPHLRSFLAVLFLLAAALAPASDNETDGLILSADEAAPLKSYGSPLVVPASEFRNTGINPDKMRHSLAYDFLQGQGEVAYAVAPVYLPDGATISSFHAAVFDGWDGGFDPCDDAVGLDVGVWLMRVDNYTGYAEQMSFLSSSGSDTEDQWLYDSSVENPTVSYPGFSYYLVTRLCHTAHDFNQAIILYSMP